MPTIIILVPRVEYCFPAAKLSHPGYAGLVISIGLLAMEQYDFVSENCLGEFNDQANEIAMFKQIHFLS